jgi:DNA-binding response OmpR family regulator
MYKNILFVEDEQFIAEMYADILRKAGFNVQIEGDGQKGYDLASTGEYDLVLLDLMLPNMTGLEILRRLRDENLSPKFTRDHHIVILTNLDEDDITKKKIFELAEGYYMKVNITPHKLAEIIKEMNGEIAVHAEN